MQTAALVGMTEREFWISTPRWYSLKVEAYSANDRNEWARTRLIAFYIIKTVDSKNKFKKLSDVLPLPGDLDAKTIAFVPLNEQELAEQDKFSQEADEIYQRLYAKQ